MCLIFLPTVLIRNLNRIKVIIIVLLINLDSWSVNYAFQCVDHSGSDGFLCYRRNLRWEKPC